MWNAFTTGGFQSWIRHCTPVFSELPVTTDIEAAAAMPDKIIQRRLVKRGNSAIPYVLIQWIGLPATSATWEDYNVLRQRYPQAPAWGQAGSSAGGDVTPGEPTKWRRAIRWRKTCSTGESVFYYYVNVFVWCVGHWPRLGIKRELYRVGELLLIW
jgi:hypothetical protein